MTDKAKLLELAERVEAATGPDRRLDIEILVTIDWREPDWEEGERTAREMAERHGLVYLTSRSVEGFNSTWRHLPRLTASLDAAMTLVPEGWCQTKRVFYAVGPTKVRVSMFDENSLGQTALAATEPLAICAAALRARAAQ